MTSTIWARKYRQYCFLHILVNRFHSCNLTITSERNRLQTGEAATSDTVSVQIAMQNLQRNTDVNSLTADRIFCILHTVRDRKSVV